MNILEWISLIGSIASIVGLILYFLEKKSLISFKMPFKYVISLVVITVVLIIFSSLQKRNEINIIQKENNDNNKIEVITD